MNLSLKRLIAGAALVLGSAGVVQAQGTFIVPDPDEGSSRVGTRGANFLHIPVGARQQALAGAAVGLSEGPSALFWNPANMAGQTGVNVFVSRMALFGNSGITNTAGAVSIELGQGAFGFGIVQYSSGEMLRTTERAPDGDDPAFPGTFAWKGTALSAHYARNLTDRLAAAIGGRYANEGMELASNGFFGVDVSTRFRTGLYGLTVGAALSNVGNRSGFSGQAVGQAITAPRNNGQPTGRNIPIQYQTQEPLMPTEFKFGVLSQIIGDAEAIAGSSVSHGLAAEIDFSKGIDTDLQTAIGVEYGFRHQFFLRTGKRFFNEQHAPWKFADGLAFGGGMRVPIASRTLVLDYGYVTMGELRNNQVFSFSFGQ
jgi:hypothetical protein